MFKITPLFYPCKIVSVTVTILALYPRHDGLILPLVYREWTYA